jgi:hypothetical protein
MYILLKQGTGGKVEVIGKSKNAVKLKHIAHKLSQPKTGSWTTNPNNHEVNGTWTIIPSK